MGVVWGVVAIIPVVFMAWVGIFFLGNVKFGNGKGPDDESAHSVTQRPYLVTLVRGDKVSDVEKEMQMESNVAR